MYGLVTQCNFETGIAESPGGIESDEGSAEDRDHPGGSLEWRRGGCPAGILRMDDKQASVVVQNQAGEQFTVNFMTDTINATNRELDARLKGDTWIITLEGGEVVEVPLAAIEGG